MITSSVVSSDSTIFLSISPRVLLIVYAVEKLQFPVVLRVTQTELAKAFQVNIK